MIKRLLAANKSIDLDQTKYAVVLALITVPLIGQAAPPTGFGTFTADAQPDPGTVASGTYKTLTQHTGKYQIIAGENKGYSGIDIIVGANGIMIKNNKDDNTDKDKLTYTFKLVPAADDANFIKTIKIAQATYKTYNDNPSTPSGNSEIARQTLDYVPNILFGPAAKATVLSNSNAPYYFGAMGDYFMGKSSTSNNQTTFTSSNPVNDQPQLRIDSTGGVGESGLYYYDITKLTGAGSNNPHILTLNRAGNVTFRSNSDKKGELPPTPTFSNILKATSTNPNNQTTYPPYSSPIIPKNTSYVSYGVNNSDSNYVIDVENAQSVTLKYEGIMNGNSGKNDPVVGETFNEWISFGVSSEIAPTYNFSGTVFNDNGGLTLEANKVGVVNSAYFNGKFDSTSGEVGVADSNLTLSLTDCSEGNTPINNTSPQLVASTGKYIFNIPRSSLQLGQTVCLVENEPAEWEYSVDTTANKRFVTIIDGKYTYDNLDFGEVTANNTSLVLIKSQYVHDCNDTRTFIDMPQNPQPNLPTNGFSTNSITGIVPGQCIAYRIEAYNRGHVDLEDIQITDKLQNKSDGKLVTSSFVMPLPMGSSNAVYNSRNPLPTGEIISLKFPLSKANGSTATKATLYYNPKYGTTVDP